MITGKEAYLIHELLKDVKYLSEEQDFETPFIEHTSSLKRYLVQEYSNDIAFFPFGKYPHVHPIDINPCTYSIAALQGCGLRDTDLTKAFGKMLRRKLRERQKDDIIWTLISEDLFSRIDMGHLGIFIRDIQCNLFFNLRIRIY